MSTESIAVKESEVEGRSNITVDETVIPIVHPLKQNYGSFEPRTSGSFSSHSSGFVSDSSSTSSVNSAGPLEKYRVYWVRWYVLIVHTLIGVGNMAVYSTWGPIEEQASASSIGLTQFDFGLLPNYFNIGFFISIFPFMWLIQTKGLRASEVATAALVTAGAALRCLSFSSFSDSYSSDRIFIHIGQFFNGLATPIPWIGCTYISAFWFPCQERSMATSIGLATTYLGQALSFLIGPSIVDKFTKIPGDPDSIRLAIRGLLYIEVIYTALVLVLALCYFPSKPPTPPSFTASVERVPFGSALKQMLRNRQVWIVMFVYAVSSAVYGSWHQVLPFFVAPAMTPEETGWLGCVVCLIIIFAAPAMLMGTKSCIAKHPKAVCTVAMLVGCVFFGALVVCARFFPQLFNSYTIWVALVVSAACWTAVEPIWWEMACEASYPLAESVVSGIFT